MIKHYQFIEVSGDLKKLCKLGKQLYVINARSHGDYEDNYVYINGKYIQDEQGYYFEQYNYDGNVLIEIDGDGVYDLRVAGYLVIEDDITD